MAVGDGARASEEKEISLSYAVGGVGKLVCGRIPPGFDLLEGIEEICAKAGIVSGNLISCVGSLKKFSFLHPRPKDGAPLGFVYDEETIDGPLEILSAEGTIGTDDQGKLFYHIHGVVVDGTGRIWGGHLVRSGAEMPDGRIVYGENPILATAEVTILEPRGVNIKRQLDPSLGVKLLVPQKDESALESSPEAQAAKQKVVRQTARGRIVVVDSISYVDENNRGDVIVGGSHGGANCGQQLSGLRVKGVILNDAGKGKENAGIKGMEVLEEHGIPGACVSSMSACIGNGMSTYEGGEVSALNEPARVLGITVGMPAREAALKMLAR